MALIFGADLAEALLEDEDLNIEKRFNTNQKDLTEKLSGATDKQQGFIYHLWQNSRNFKIYEVLKSIGLKTL